MHHYTRYIKYLRIYFTVCRFSFRTMDNTPIMFIKSFLDYYTNTKIHTLYGILTPLYQKRSMSEND